MREPVDWPTRDVLSHRAVTTPDRTGVVDVETNRKWTFGAFDALVDDVARQLRDRLPEETPDARVASLVSTRTEFVAVFHATLRLGAQFVPLNVRLAAPELGPRLARVTPDLLVCEYETAERATETASCPLVSLDPVPTTDVETVEQEGSEDDGSVEPARWRRDDVSLVTFTSGTTGKPKGVRLTLGNLVASATASAFRLGVQPEDRWLCCLPAYHMGGLAPLVRCPLYGTTLLVQRAFDATTTGEIMEEFDVTGVSLVPTQLTRLLDADWEPPESLQTVLLGGAPASRSLVERALDADVPVYPTYGLTETASQVATARPAEARDFPETVGQPLVCTEVTVVSEDGTPVERGETGELVVDGPTVTPGYLDAERTADAFGRFGLHTGDVGHRDEAGRIRVLGRADDTIVTGGENVHPSEVVTVLEAHDAVDDAAVVGIPDEEWGERIGALVVPDEAAPDAAAIEAFLRERLADYKVPKTLEIVATLPRTQSGTVDREAVRARLVDR